VSLADAELYETADVFGVDLEQVRRDHVISHALASISARAREVFLFTGGTMLSRTWLPNLRLSEDIDLMVYLPRAEAGGRLAEALEVDLADRFGPLAWDKDPRTAADTESIYLAAGEDVTIKFQLVDTTDRARWPHEERDIMQRYSDAPPARLLVPTAPTVVAMKLTAWVDRRTPRDLYDLWAMSQRGMITADAVETYRRFGQSGQPLSGYLFSHPPTEIEWEDALGHQCRLQADPTEAIEAVGYALAAFGAIRGGYEPDHSPETSWLSRPQSRRSRVPVSEADRDPS